MFTTSTIKHLRIPFSLFLMPVFLFAVSQNINTLNVFNAIIAFVVLHLFIYPASNGYNSYFDKDEGSIGGLKHPPKVSQELYWASLLFDIVGILLALVINVWFAIMVFIYGMISKAYSHPVIRLKKYPYWSWWTVGIFQGGFTYLMSCAALLNGGFEMILSPSVYVPAILSTLLLLGSYPMTQIYQHEEDKSRGDITISILVGIKGSFYLTAALFTISMIGFLGYYLHHYAIMDFVILMIFLLPVFGYFLYWFLKVLKNEEAANFDHTMRFNLVSSSCLILYFVFFSISSYLS